jgi:hypothetical protein
MVLGRGRRELADIDESDFWSAFSTDPPSGVEGALECRGKAFAEPRGYTLAFLRRSGEDLLEVSCVLGRWHR